MVTVAAEEGVAVGLEEGAEETLVGVVVVVVVVGGAEDNNLGLFRLLETGSAQIPSENACAFVDCFLCGISVMWPPQQVSAGMVCLVTLSFSVHLRLFPILEIA